MYCLNHIRQKNVDVILTGVMNKDLVLFGPKLPPPQSVGAKLGNPKSGWFTQAKGMLDGVKLMCAWYSQH